MSEAIREGDMVLTPGEFGRVVGDASGPMVVVDHDGHCSVYPLDEVEAVYDTLSARDAFAELWERVHGDGAWERDRTRWVWVYGFEVAS